MFIVKFNYQGADFFLRGTIWVDEHNRANKFATEGDAGAPLLKELRSSCVHQ